MVWELPAEPCGTTSGIALLPTPTAADGDRSSPTYWGNPTLLGSLLPTPGARLGDGRGDPDPELAADRMDAGRRNLDDAVALLPTPTARDAIRGRGRQHPEGRPLSEVIALLPTPLAGDSKGTRNATTDRRSPKASTYTDGWTLGDVAHADRWGEYGPAVRRHEFVTGMPAPEPTEPGTKLQPRLAPAFVEWMQGLPAGWVTDHIGRNPALARLGNGIAIPAGAYALPLLLPAMEPARSRR
jgi:DNA (cytosine-5)-methyltransferase 1